ncbi:MAG: hypothetical protein ACLTR6_15150 [Clostridium fessum]
MKRIVPVIALNLQVDEKDMFHVAIISRFSLGRMMLCPEVGGDTGSDL